MPPVEGLRAALRLQVESVEAGSHAAEDASALRRAERTTIELAEELGLALFLGALTLDDKPRFLLWFSTPSAGPLAGASTSTLVLKVYPDRPRGEGPVLITWHDRGIPVPETRCGERNGCSWLVLDHLDLTPLYPRSIEDVFSLTTEVARYARLMHAPAPFLGPVLRPLDEVMVSRWEGAAQVLAQQGYKVHPEWRASARRAYSEGSPALLHGDIGPPNMGRDPRGRLVVYDPSALWGSREFDAVRWAARLTSEDVSPQLVLERWLGIEGLEFSEGARLLLGAECLLEAGSRIVSSSRNTGAAGLAGGVTAVPLLFEEAARLLR